MFANKAKNRKVIFLSTFFILLFSTWYIYPAFFSVAPAWMGAADGFMLAQARFFEKGLGLGVWNRFWFLGIPVNHIGSPVLPWILSLLTRSDLVTQAGGPVSNFSLWRSLVAIGVVGSVVGTFLFVRELFLNQKRGSKKKQFPAWLIATFVALFTLVVPSVLLIFPQIIKVLKVFKFPSWTIFSPFYLGDGQKTIGFALVMLGSVLAYRLIRVWSQRGMLFFAILCASILLVDSLSFLTLLLWVLVLLLTTIVEPKLRQDRLIPLALRIFIVSLLALLLTSFWFTPSMIANFISAPSLGGRPFALVAVGIVRRFAGFLPVLFGILAARKWLRRANPGLLVGFMGLLVFGGLTLAAWFADVDFWTDYSRFGRSMDLSFALLVGGLFYGKKTLKRARVLALLLLFLGIPFLINRKVLLSGSFKITATSEYRSSKALEQIIGEVCDGLEGCGLRAYLSGSSVFWLNSWFDFAQVRGGGEQGSVNDWWPHGSYQIREGVDPELSQLWLEALGVDYLLVHEADSQEIFHDFRWPGKFSRMKGWKKIWEDQGDMIYGNLEAFSIARVADSGVASIASPEKGDDLKALQSYVSLLGKSVEFHWLGKREFEVKADLEPGEGVRVAVAYSPFWHVSEASGKVSIEKDILGMIFINPSGSGLIKVRLQFNPWLDVALGVVISVGALLVLLRKPEKLLAVARRLEHLVGKDTELDRSAV